MCRENGMHGGGGRSSQKGRDHQENLDVGGRIILRWIFVWTGLD
jgi:hypothetical protein